MPLTCDLIIPAYNEIDNIDAVLSAVAEVRGRLEDGDGLARLRHVVVADNGSTDGTAEAAAKGEAVVVSEAQRGYGAACLKALAWIGERVEKPDAVAFLDADLSDDPAKLGDLLDPLARGEADIVIGSRVRRADPGALNIVQRFGNALACRLIALFGGRRYSDLGPFRAIRWTTLLRLGMADRTWGWTVEMQMKAALMHLPVVEIDVPYRRRRAGRSKISGTIGGVVRAGTKIVGTIVVLWWSGRGWHSASGAWEG